MRHSAWLAALLAIPFLAEPARRKGMLESVLSATLDFETHPAPDTETVARERSKTA